MDKISSSVVSIVGNSDTTPLINSNVLSDVSIWSSAESGYYTTPSSTESSATKVKNDTSNLSLSAKLRSKTITSCETPKFRGVKKLRKRASSLTDMIDHHLIDTNCSLPEFDSGFVNSCKQAQSSDDYCFIASPISNDNVGTYKSRRRYHNKQEINPQLTLMTLLEEQHDISIFEAHIQNSFSDQGASFSKFEQQTPNNYHENGISPESKSCPVSPVKQKQSITKNRESKMLCFTIKPNQFYSPIFSEKRWCENISYKNDDNNIKKTPTKRFQISAESEKNNILYHVRPITPPKSSASNLSPNKQRVITKSKNYLGFKTKLDFKQSDEMDIMDKLAEFDLVWGVLKYLYDEDLCRFCMVSKRWRDICLKDSAASRRRSKFLLEKSLDKENYVSVVKKATSGPSEALNIVKNVVSRKNFAEIQNSTSDSNISVSPPVSPKRATLLKFVQAAKKLDPQICLKKCPKCSGPAHPSSKKINENFMNGIEVHEMNLQGKNVNMAGYSDSSSQSKIEQNINAKVNHEISTNTHENIQKNNYTIVGNKTKGGIDCKKKNNEQDSINTSVGKIECINKDNYCCRKLNNTGTKDSVSTSDNLNFDSSRKNKALKRKISFIEKCDHSINNKNICVCEFAQEHMPYNIDNTDNRNQIVQYCCDSNRCGYSFCALCLGPAHINDICPQTELRLQAHSPPRLSQETENCRNSKKIKKSLRRLL